MPRIGAAGSTFVGVIEQPTGPDVGPHRQLRDEHGRLMRWRHGRCDGEVGAVVEGDEHLVTSAGDDVDARGHGERRLRVVVVVEANSRLDTGSHRAAGEEGGDDVAQGRAGSGDRQRLQAPGRERRRDALEACFAGEQVTNEHE